MLNHPILNFTLAMLPILWLISALCIFKIKAHVASLSTLLIAFLEAIFFWHMQPLHAASAALEGVIMAFWPIVVIIIAAVFTYNLTVYTGAMNTIKRMIISVTPDKRLLAILIGWCFGGFLEGMAGFGVSMAIPASMLCALGFDPITAILACLVANSCPTMFGSVGVPTTTLASVTSLSSNSLAYAQAIMTAPLLFISPFIMIVIVGKGFKALKDVLPFTLVASLSFLIPNFLTAKYTGAELGTIIAGICSLSITLLYTLHYSKNHHTPDNFLIDAPKADDQVVLNFKNILVAWSPFLLIFIFLVLTSKIVPAINGPLSSIKTVLQIYQGPNATPYTLSWFSAPGLIIFIAGIIGGLIQKCDFKGFKHVFVFTIRQMSKTIITMTGVLACARIMGHSGMIQDIANFLVALLGSYYPLAAPFIGTIGTFVTGSATSSGVLFGNVQLEAAHAIGANEFWLVGSNSLGTVAGKMISPQSIAIGCASCDLNGKDGEILAKVFKYALLYMIIASIIVYLGTII